MEPITLVLIAAAALVTTVVVLAVLNWSRILNWFQSRKGKISDKDKKNIAFTLKQELSSGNVEVIQGIFDTNTDEIEDAVKYQAETLDAQTEKTLSGSSLKIYS